MTNKLLLSISWSRSIQLANRCNFLKSVLHDKESILGRFFFFSPNVFSRFYLLPQLWCSRMISMQVQKPCSADTLMTQQQTRTSPKGNGVCWLSLPSSSFATNRPSITSHAFLHSLPFTHFDSVYLFDNEVIGPSLFECMLSWLHCMQLCMLIGM